MSSLGRLAIPRSVLLLLSQRGVTCEVAGALSSGLMLSQEGPYRLSCLSSLCLLVIHVYQIHDFFQSSKNRDPSFCGSPIFYSSSVIHCIGSTPISAQTRSTVLWFSQRELVLEEFSLSLFCSLCHQSTFSLIFHSSAIAMSHLGTLF